RRWGVSIIGMTNMPEAKLAREAELCYATLALVTDYDVWHDEHDAVSVEAVVANLMKNVATAREVLSRVIPLVPESCAQGCPDALRPAVPPGPAVAPAAGAPHAPPAPRPPFPPPPGGSPPCLSPPISTCSVSATRWWTCCRTPRRSAWPSSAW